MKKKQVVRYQSTHTILGAVEEWRGYETEEIKCPICLGQYQHVESPHFVSGNDDYDADWGGRGDLVVIPFWGECGHQWELCIGFHKGNSYIFARVPIVNAV